MKIQPVGNSDRCGWKGVSKMHGWIEEFQESIDYIEKNLTEGCETRVIPGSVWAQFPCTIKTL